MRITVDGASKLVKQYNEKISNLRSLRNERMFYTTEESRVDTDRPDFSLTQNAKELDSLIKKVCAIKHEINKFNSSYVVFGDMTIDACLVYLKFLTTEKCSLSRCVNSRESVRVPAKVSGMTEYTYRNFTQEEADTLCGDIDADIIAIQSAINRANVTEEIEIDL